MKKILLIVLALAVGFCLPLTAQAKTEFELGGYIRLDAMYNSQNGVSHSLASFCARDNGASADHGRFLMNANATRFNFTIKGPELWGGKVTGFIEADFDGQDTAAANSPGTGLRTSDSSFNQAKLRLRHAMFKINWPDREVLFGQYWSINSELIPETADSGGYCLYGATQLRLPQVRYTQKFAEYFSASLALEDPANGRWGINLDNTNPTEGEMSETPMVEAKLRYEQDLYGKAGWYGKPRALYIGLGAGYFRTRANATSFANTRTNNYAWTPGGPWTGAGATTTASNWNTLGQEGYGTPWTNPGLPAIPAVPGVVNVATVNTNTTLTVPNMNYCDHWLFLIENFTPIIPTVTKNLAGTMSLAQQWWIGQGVSAWRLDLPQSDRYYAYSGVGTGANNFNYKLNFIKRYGGWAQLQYYWTGEIFTNVNFGFEKAFGFNGMQRDVNLVTTNNPLGYIYANPTGYDPVKSTWRAGITQWYRPVAAVKFALQYQYMRTDYFQATTVGSTKTNFGDNHSLMANAWYMF